MTFIQQLGLIGAVVLAWFVMLVTFNVLVHTLARSLAATMGVVITSYFEAKKKYLHDLTEEDIERLNAESRGKRFN